MAAGEYEYYEFRALDRPLEDAEYDQVRAQLPEQARITRRRALSECRAGEFRGDQVALMERHFDAHLCATAAGRRTLMIRLPLDRFDLAAAAQYTSIDTGPARRVRGRGEPFAIRRCAAHAIVTWRGQECAQAPDRVRFSLDRLVRTRAELEFGDRRPLYLGWLAALGASRDPRDAEPEDEGWGEPPVPPGLRNLTYTQRGLVEFLRLDPDVLAAAASTQDWARCRSSPPS